jgi:hypothetical protein
MCSVVGQVLFVVQVLFVSWCVDMGGREGSGHLVYVCNTPRMPKGLVSLWITNNRIFSGLTCVRIAQQTNTL